VICKAQKKNDNHRKTEFDNTNIACNNTNIVVSLLQRRSSIFSNKWLRNKSCNTSTFTKFVFVFMSLCVRDYAFENVFCFDLALILTSIAHAKFQRRNEVYETDAVVAIYLLVINVVISDCYSTYNKKNKQTKERSLSQWKDCDLLCSMPPTTSHTPPPQLFENAARRIVAFIQRYERQS
jgi:hypothetical protein